MALPPVMPGFFIHMFLQTHHIQHNLLGEINPNKRVLLIPCGAENRFSYLKPIEALCWALYKGYGGEKKIPTAKCGDFYVICNQFFI